METSIEKVKEAKRAFMQSLTKLRVFETDEAIPILALQHPDPEVDLYEALLQVNVLAIGGLDGLGKNTVRIRIPAQIEPLIAAVRKIEQW